MKPILYPFLVLASIGFTLSVSAHVLALAGLTPPGGKSVFALHIGIFVVWLPTVLVASRINRNVPKNEFWKATLSGAPAWMVKGCYALLAYAIINFLLFAITQDNHQSSSSADIASQIRGFSGHWMIFYAAAFTTLYSVIRAPHLLSQRTCP